MLDQIARHRAARLSAQASWPANAPHAAPAQRRYGARQLRVSAQQDTQSDAKKEPDAEESLAALEDMVRGGSAAKEARTERKRRRKEQQGTSTNDFSSSPAPKDAQMPTDAQVFEGRIVTILLLLFVLGLGEGLAVAGSGFMSEAGDAFVQDVVYRAFTPTIGLFLAVSTFYGVWKQRQEQGQQ